MIFGLWTREGYSGRLYQTTTLGRTARNVKVEKSKQRMTVAFLCFCDWFERKNSCSLEVGQSSMSSKV